MQNHAYTILEALEIDIGGVPKKLLKIRNPWGSTAWSGAYSEGTPEYNALDAALPNGIVEEAGKFWMEYVDFLVHFPDVDMSFSQESKTGGVEQPEYRPRLDLPETGKQYIQVHLGEDINLDNDFFSVHVWQGGNRLGTDRDPAFSTFDTGYFYGSIVPLV